MSGAPSRTPIADQILAVLKDAFRPQHLELENESDQHAGPPGRESHFRLVLVSDAMAGKSKVQRHQEIYRVLGALIGNPVHALAMHLYTPAEWAASAEPPASPACHGGDGPRQ